MKIDLIDLYMTVGISMEKPGKDKEGKPCSLLHCYYNLKKEEKELLSKYENITLTSGSWVYSPENKRDVIAYYE